ncbi:polyamine-modulated factor 1-like [Dendronephthya gigantea]|uniref:polyamine-modulated factor 1-like n=1 Tax=Dendronephthya gigantea TaxID=151771 RepID=UPI00106961F9|nr:polyamine-modulated factor 1-like [Dendronephthya gigantea]
MAGNKEREIQSGLAGNFEAEKDDEAQEKEICNNFSHIKELLDMCTQKCLAPVRFKKISSCFKKVREKNPAIFDSIVPQLIEHLKVNIEQELELMFQQENLVHLCQQLDELQPQSIGQEEAWRPSGTPSEDIKDHVLSVKLELRQKLRDKLKQLQDENETLKRSLHETREEITETEKRITAKHNELQKISSSCDSLTTCNNNEDNKYSLEEIIKELNR